MATPEEMAQSMRSNVAEKTGKSIAEWFAIIAPAKLDKHGQIVKFLKTEHSMTHGFANLIARDFLAQGAEEPTGEALILQQYSGAKADLKPVYDAIIARLADFDQVEISPKKTYVSLRHNKQFAIIQPSTKTRVDVGINAKDLAVSERLEQSGSFNSMVSHRVRITHIDQVDDELINWLRHAWSKN